MPSKEIIKTTVEAICNTIRYDNLNEQLNNVLRSGCVLLNKLSSKLSDDEEANKQAFQIIVTGLVVLFNATQKPFDPQLTLCDLRKDYLFHHKHGPTSKRDFSFWTLVAQEKKNNIDLIMNIGIAVLVDKKLHLAGLVFDQPARLLPKNEWFTELLQPKFINNHTYAPQSAC